jgi:hypothetical protein
VGPRRLNYPSEGMKIRTLASHRLVELLLARGALDTCEERGLTRMDLLVALRTCAVIGSERRGGQWRRTVRGNDIDGNSIMMVVTVVYQVRRILVLEVEVES